MSIRLLVGCLFALGLFAGSVSGCFGNPEPPKPVEEFTAPKDVPMPEGFELKSRSPIPFSSTTGSFRQVKAAWIRKGAMGSDKVAIHFVSELLEQGWTQGVVRDESAPGTVSGQRWTGRFTKGRSVRLLVTYEERHQETGNGPTVVGEIRIDLTGSE